MINAANKSFPEPAVSEYVGSVFSQNREELEWLANFLTGDENIADACVVDACAQAESEISGLQEWPPNGPRCPRSAPLRKSSINGLLNFPPHTCNLVAFTGDTRSYLPIGVTFYWRNQGWFAPDSISSVASRW